MGKKIFLFSGQGSQYVGMAKELCEKYSQAKVIFEIAGDVLGRDISKIVFEGPQQELDRTVNSQPGIMACSLAAFEAAKAEGIEFSGAAGHSLGEYAAMAAAGIITVEDGFKLIKARAEAMEKAAKQNGGAMYAIIGADVQTVAEVCENTQGYVVPVNYNSPVQTVIAGEEKACEQAAQTFAQMKKKAVKLNVAAAFHSKFMQPAAEEFEKTAKEITYSQAKADFYSNYYGEKLSDFSDMPKLLAQHIVSPVRFTQELNQMQKDGYDTFIELGPNKVLTGLVKKTLKGVLAVNIEDCSSMEKALARIEA